MIKFSFVTNVLSFPPVTHPVRIKKSVLIVVSNTFFLQLGAPNTCQEETPHTCFDDGRLTRLYCAAASSCFFSVYLVSARPTGSICFFCRFFFARPNVYGSRLNACFYNSVFFPHPSPSVWIDFNGFFINPHTQHAVLAPDNGVTITIVARMHCFFCNFFFPPFPIDRARTKQFDGEIRSPLSANIAVLTVNVFKKIIIKIFFPTLFSRLVTTRHQQQYRTHGRALSYLPHAYTYVRVCVCVCVRTCARVCTYGV